MILEAKLRLMADSQQVDQAIENKKKQIKNLKRSLPSRQNRRSMSQVQRLNTRRQILNLEDQIVNERLKEAQNPNLKSKD